MFKLPPKNFKTWLEKKCHNLYHEKNKTFQKFDSKKEISQSCLNTKLQKKTKLWSEERKITIFFLTKNHQISKFWPEERISQSLLGNKPTKEENITLRKNSQNKKKLTRRNKYHNHV